MIDRSDNQFLSTVPSLSIGSWKCFMMNLLLLCRQENDRLHMDLDRMRVDLPYGRSRSPDPRADPSYGTRVAVEVADLQDKLEKAQADLRRSQAELRLNQGDYERSHVELEQMQEKVNSTFGF